MDNKIRDIEEQLNALKVFNSGSSTRPRNFSRYRNNNTTCYGCGEVGHFHGSDLCKAKGQQCHSCHKRDHFAHVCFSNKRKDTKHNSNYTNRNTPSTSHASFNKTNFSKTDNRNNILSLNNVTRDSDSSDEFLFKISGSGVCNDVFVFVDNFKCPFQVDSGASCNIMDYGTFVQMCETQPFSLGSDGTRVFPYGSSEPLCLKGHFLC